MPNSDSPTITPSARRRRDRGSRGQIIVIFAGAAIAFMALSAIVIDVSWYWSSQVRMQRAADAAALAGVVRLPGDLAGGKTLARTEASRNGYTDGVNQVVVTPDQDPASSRRMVVTISGPINTFFARIIGLNSFPATVTSKAQFVLPVPMGSPENYWGVFGKTRALTSTTTTSTPNPPIASNTSSGLDIATTSTPGTWTASSGTLVNAVATNDAGNAPRILTTTNGAQQVFGGFGLTSQLTTETVTAIRGIEVYLDDSFLSASCAATTNRIQVQLSWNAGGQWTTPITTNQTASMTTTTTIDTVFGSTNLLTNWVFSGPAHTWGVNDILDANFRVRLTAVKGCATATTELRLDQLRVKAYYSITTPQPPTLTTTTTTLPDVDLKGPGDPCPSGVADCYSVTNGATLTPHGFWGTMNTEGAANANGDAFQPYYDNPLTSTAAVACAVATPGIACYDPNEYYNYAVEMPQGSTNGKVYIYDPVFCDVDVNTGTGDRFFDLTTGDGTPIDTDAVTSMYEVWDTKNTLYDRGDDGPLNNGTTPDASSGDLFRNIRAADSTMGGYTTGGVPECRNYTNTPYGDGRDFHNKWYLLYSGMSGYASGPHIYRIHTTSTDPASPTQQRIANGENSFAIFASASGGTPKVYGLGAMQAFTPLSAAGTTVTSEFYLAQIDKVHATKTVEVALWDAGDTNPLTSSLEILIPTSTGWAATPVTYSATLGTTNPGRADGTSSKPDCRTQSRTTASSSPISTYTTGAPTTVGKFNGCWLTIQAVIPGSYNADQGGWWKIRYTMTGGTVSTPATSVDVTTWKVQILGNPVHLIVN